MKVAVVSDTHGRMGWEIPECDVFVHAGDITAGGSRTETRKFVKFLKEQAALGKFFHALIIPGNHDRALDLQREETLGYFDDPRFHVLINQGIEIEGKTFWGSPYTPPFFNWFFMAEEGNLFEMYKKIPENLDMLITHGPPFGILDPGFQADHVGSPELLKAVERRNISHHVFGHLHAAGGKTVYGDGIHYHNVAACDEAYKLVRQPIIIEL